MSRSNRAMTKPTPSALGSLALLAVASTACGPGAREDVLYVYAASSLQDAVREAARVYESENGGKVVLNTGSSGKLSVQIEQGGRADVFLSAGDVEMDRLQGLGLVLEDSRRVLVSNQLVVVVPSGERPVDRPADLAADWVEVLSIGHPGYVPAGRYAQAWLERAGLWDAVEARVLPGVNVRAALTAVGHGGANAGIVYATDAATSGRVKVTFRVPLHEGPRIAYPVAAMAERPRETRARGFVDFLASAEIQAIFERHGFLTADGG